MATHLVWLRNDLRIHDNTALHAACRDSDARVLALFIATPQQWHSHVMAPRQAAFIYQSLQDVQQSLAEKGIPLHFLQCRDFDASVSELASFCQAHNIERMFYNYQYEVNERQRDARVERALSELDIISQGFDDSLLLAPGSVLTGSGEMYKVFTPFSKALVRRLKEGVPECLPVPKARENAPLKKTPTLKPFDYPSEAFDDQLFPAGEAAALKRLRAFCQQPAADYPQQRDIPAVDGTSRLSVYLATGVLSPRQCLNRLLREHADGLDNSRIFVWLNELIWREFYRHLLVAWPSLCRHQPFIGWTEKVKWQQNGRHLEAWQQGKTGYPVVDAAMRQLNALGWMHNRLRMIVASFLVKDLLIDWREGERYFMSQLIDGDLAANNGGWQWAASCGTDAAPYFRIFNPTTQGERFDEEGAFIRQWLPELKAVPKQHIHQPQAWAKKHGVSLDYPQPIVDHKEARKTTLAAFEAARK
ncbi:deoxyribodipyrimidine photo-lyase [Erwinia tracheiphila]|uniref:Deoxyribodipyrimidine photo-lyase n=1 Tax=Erwinia tracheiphila TaxID=65700 RepID=A0A0M2KFF4_9GAMM|nr:deoxyribodipyrimidine photo-lyase [Erwinia tracheiphila]AXF75253.1 deoxyribodipyrimidine photo-lyase [Erwinia tracheiphila]EOS94007.1 deoxyribodipyrimidine photolyase [Erwinia tracheiphila PSU-1]KKF38125.1 deoxyribodipyrimidine photolyase [Erwinia tracheiphila]UIA82203.1 deoxyribodipyrimidine photo-lyase [Erwinia tracheiphila]UIA89519.1 deoxyribodipyrimidine photo-lyase [Erwinia tracheiphila]